MNHDYFCQAVDIIKKIKLFALEDDWIIMSDPSDKTVLKKKYFPEVSETACYFMIKQVNKSDDYLINREWRMTEEEVKKHDSTIVSSIDIEFGLDWRIVHQVNSICWPVWPRDLVFTQFKIIDGNTTWIVGNSIEHVHAPHNPLEYIRATIHMTAWGFTPINQNKTMVTRVLFVDPHGNIPEYFINATISRHVNIVNNLDKN